MMNAIQDNSKQPTPITPAVRKKISDFVMAVSRRVVTEGPFSHYNYDDCVRHTRRPQPIVPDSFVTLEERRAISLAAPPSKAPTEFLGISMTHPNVSFMSPEGQTKIMNLWEKMMITRISKASEVAAKNCGSLASQKMLKKKKKKTKKKKKKKTRRACSRSPDKKTRRARSRSPKKSSKRRRSRSPKKRRRSRSPKKHSSRDRRRSSRGDRHRSSRKGRGRRS